MLGRYKEGLDVDREHSGIVTAACDVIKYARLHLGNDGKDEKFIIRKRDFFHNPGNAEEL